MCSALMSVSFLMAAGFLMPADFHYLSKPNHLFYHHLHYYLPFLLVCLYYITAVYGTQYSSKRISLCICTISVLCRSFSICAKTEKENLNVRILLTLGVLCDILLKKESIQGTAVFCGCVFLLGRVNICR